MAEDLDDYRRIFDGGDDLQSAAAVGAVFNVDVEDPFEEPGPAHARCFSLSLGVIGRGSVARSGGLGTILLRNFALGASTPWKRIRCKRGRGTRAARRSMNSSAA